MPRTQRPVPPVAVDPPANAPRKPAYRETPRQAPRDAEPAPGPKSRPNIVFVPPSEGPTITPGKKPQVTFLPSPPRNRDRPWVVGDPGQAKPTVITKAPDRFDRPLPPRGGSSGGAGGLTPGLGGPAAVTPLVSHSAPRGLIPAGETGGRDRRGSGDGVSVFVGIGVGATAGRWHCPPPPRYSGCFSHHSYYSYPDPFCAAPWYYGPSYWACDPWGGYYTRGWCYWPSWWWYPTYYVRSYPCGTFSYVRYARHRHDWLVHFSFGYSPCYEYTSCGLTSPRVYSCYEPAPLAWSTNGLYKYGWVHGSTVSCIGPAIDPEPSAFYASAETLPAPATDFRGSSDRELADVYMRLGDLPSAIRVYADHTARFPGDVEALRSMGLALLETGRAEEGVELVERAYLIDPSLAQRPFPIDLLAARARIEAALDAAARKAASENSPRAWLAVAALMQADGRTGPARAALDKAAAGNLNSGIVESMRAALPTGQE